MQRSFSQVMTPNQEAEVDPAEEPAGAPQGPKQSPIHVLFLIDHLMALGGGESNLLKVAKLLPPERVRCSIATFRIKPEIRQGISVPVYVFPWRRVYHLSAWKAAFALRRLIRRQHVDIVQTYFESSNLWGGLVAKLSGAALLSSRRDMGILRNRKHKLAYGLINRLADRVLAVSEEVKRFCVDQEHIKPGKISVVYNGVDLRQLASAGRGGPFEHADWAGASHVVTCVANVRRIKGIDVLVRCAERVCRELPGTVFLIAGSLYEKEYSQEIQEMVRARGLEENIKLLGFIQDPVPLLKMSHAFCLLSRSEGFSNALLEAMACGVPSVVTSVGGNPEAIVDGKNGFLVPAEDHEAAAERLLTLLNNPAKAMEIGNAGRVTAETRFSADAMIQQLLDLYDRLMAARRPRKR
jgi:glycosyltransferase involved in cell wall biosynthesis